MIVGFFGKQAFVLSNPTVFFYVPPPKVTDFPSPSSWDWVTAEWNSLAPWIGSWGLHSNLDCDFGNRSESLSVSHLKSKKGIGTFEDKRQNRFGFLFQQLKRKGRRVLCWLKDSGFLWVWGLPSSWPSDEPSSYSPMTKQEVTPEVRMRSEDEPPWWADWARENSNQHYRWLSQHQRAALSPQDRAASLCLFYAVVKREKSSHSALKVLFSIFCLIFSIFFSLDIIPLTPRNPHVFPLPCHVDIFTVEFLCWMCHWPKCCSMAKDRTYL